MARKKQQTVHGLSREEILSPLPLVFRSRLLSMYNGEPQVGSDGERHNLDGKTRIDAEEGMWLYKLCCEAKPKTTLEIGLAYGFSTLYFLAAICENGFGQHTAVDPFQRPWHGIGLHHARTLGGTASFRYLEELSTSAFVHLADQGETFEVIFIDGSHYFENALTDFALSAGLCPIGGYIILDDAMWPSIRRVAAFIRSNRKDFEEFKTPVGTIAAFRRIGEDTRKWEHFVEFYNPLGSYYDMRCLIRTLAPAFVRRGARAIARLVRP